ncbi:MAG: cytochrome c1 [Gammaproteobacteria bacterium]|nr:cytochrome c1 [Gammaproteobacteria bacterium]
MKTLTSIVFLAGSLFVSVAGAAGGGAELQTPRIDQSNTKSLQRGAATFVNYCMGCHTAAYHRYSRMARDLGLSESDVENNLIFTTDKTGAPTKVGSLMTNSMTEDYAKQAFGVVPPNLALTARSRGVDWIYTYMKSFYADPERGVGVNNIVYPGAAMPHVLWDLQGEQRPVYREEHGQQVFDSFEQVSPGKLSVEEYDKLVADLTNFLAYLADPIKQTRHAVGFWVILFLLVLLALSVMLKREYWKDIIK